MSYSQSIFGQNQSVYSFKNDTVYVVLEVVKNKQICTVIGVYEDKNQAELTKNQFPTIRKICSSTLTKSDTKLDFSNYLFNNNEFNNNDKLKNPNFMDVD